MIFILILTILTLLIYGMVQAGVHEGEHLFDFEPLIEMTREVIFVIKKRRINHDQRG